MLDTPLDMTVLVCTYNNSAVLRETLERLAMQVVDATVSWEVLVVNNNCSDDTVDVVRSLQASGRLSNLRLLSESHQGVAYARRTGMQAARGRVIGFIDDDCWVEANWLEIAIQFAIEHPRAGVFGGRNELLFQQPPPAYVVAYGASLARQDFGDTEFQMPSVGKQMPVGAGLLLRHDALLESGWLRDGCLRGREPRLLGAGEDTEIGLYIRNAGWEVWYTPRLRLQHVIPPHRTTLEYLRKLHRGFGRVEVYLRNLSLRQHATWSVGWKGLTWSLREMLAVWQRFYLGYVIYEPERPTWLIRLSYATGCLEGAVRFLFTGASR